MKFGRLPDAIYAAELRGYACDANAFISCKVVELTLSLALHKIGEIDMFIYYLSKILM